MKKLILLLGSFLLVGCTSNNQDILKSFKDYNNKFESYELKADMKIINGEDEFTYDVEVGVKDQEKYKVSLTNTINNHEQIILKNEEGIYVVTPELNKSFKFMSEWPNNSSQAYLIESLVRDVNKDDKTTIKETKEGYTITTKVNYPNNQNMDHEVITTDKNFLIKSINVQDIDNKDLIIVNIKDIKNKAKFNKTYFDLNELVTTNDKKLDTNKTDDECMNSCTSTEEECKNTCKIESTGNILKDIIYPLYVPTDTYLSSKDTVSTENGNRIILTFAGVDPFILVEEASSYNDEMNIIPVSGEPLFLSGSIGAISNNSIYWTMDGIDYYLTSKTLDAKEMMTIAESVQNSSNIVASLK